MYGIFTVPTFAIKSTIHVGKYTSPMDPMGYQRISWDRGCRFCF